MSRNKDTLESNYYNFVPNFYVQKLHMSNWNFLFVQIRHFSIKDKNMFDDIRILAKLTNIFFVDDFEVLKASCTSNC